MSFPRALGGGPLLGDRLVRIVYLDEAGTSRPDGDFAVVAGVIVHGDHQLTGLKAALADLVAEHLPPEDRDKPVIHATDVFGGNRYFDEPRKPEWTEARRFAILRDLAAIPDRFNLTVTFALVPKKEYSAQSFGAQTPKDHLRGLVGLAYLSCLLEVEEWFAAHAKQENCFVVFEDNQDVRQHIKDLQRQHQDPRIVEKLDDEAKQYWPLKRIHEDPNFQEKRAAHPLVVADFVAFFIKRIMGGDRRALEFFEPWIHRSATHQRALRDLVQRFRQ